MIVRRLARLMFVGWMLIAFTHCGLPHVHTLHAPQRIYRQGRWSPDGTTIAIIGGRIASGRLPQSIVLLKPDGTLVREITAFPGAGQTTSIYALDWRADGMLTAAVDMSTPADVRSSPLPDRIALFLIDPNHPDTAPQLLRENLTWFTSMDWSPDNQVLLLDQKFGIPPRLQPDVRPRGLSAYTPASDDLVPWQLHDSYLLQPRWHPDGQEVMYIAVTYPGRISDTPTDRVLLFRRWPDGVEERWSREPNCGLYEPAWSPDGTWIVYREVCQNVNGRRIDHLVIAPRARPLEQIEICDGHSFIRPEWGTNGKILATTIAMGYNELVLCDLPDDLDHHVAGESPQQGP